MNQEDSIETAGRTIHWPRLYDFGLSILSLGRERQFRREILGVAQLQPGERVLDVGCGTGTLAIAAATEVGDSGRVHGVDPSAKMVARARTKAQRAGANVQFEVGVIERLGFPDHCLDVVLNTLVWHHLPEPVQRSGLAELHRVLVPGGRFVIVDFGRPGAETARVIATAKDAGFESTSVARLPPTFYSLVARTGSA